MSRPNVDDVINYLSVKFNKIFCDREFVCCVTEDFQTILDNKNRCCVLVFPTLGPIYLKALRYQARIFDLAVFNIASGRFRSVAVCHKEHLLRKASEPKEDTPTMAEATLSRRKRPERQLYVPPAQRKSRLSARHTDKRVSPKKINNNNNNNESVSLEAASECSSVLSLSDAVDLFYSLNSFPSHFPILPKNLYRHRHCQFNKFLSFKNLHSSLFNCEQFIPVYDSLVGDIHWKLSSFVYGDVWKGNSQSYPVFDFKLHDLAAAKPPAVLTSFELSDFEISIQEFNQLESSVYKIVCDKFCDHEESYKILDLAVMNLGHFFLFTMEDNYYFYECQENHDAEICCHNKRRELENSEQIKRNSPDKSESNYTKHTKPDDKTMKNNLVISKMKTNEKKVVINKNEHEQEKEIMRKTKENINRKTRPIMKYVDDENDTLRIDKNDSVNNWEDLFDDNGQIQEELFTEIVEKVGDDVTIVRATEDYTAYTNKPPEELEHVVELYNFPSTLETRDLVQAFSDINSDAMYIKWVDDTHALLVLGSSSQAQMAINMKNPLIQVRPMTTASAASMDVANKSDLRPAMKRPPTNLQTARRLITTHLGTKSKLSKEQMAKERQDLKEAREMKRLMKQNEKDAWEGKLRSSVN